MPVYPRECGGTSFCMSPLYGTQGLSPRVRGNPGLPQGGHGPLGSIPASAGEPSASGSQTANVSVYPRECGGTSRGLSAICHWRGLSPRVRGNRHHLPLQPVDLGSIPASAGEPRCTTAPCPSGGVYPRECGGTRVSRRSRSSFSGLSPRVRGNPGCDADFLGEHRSIPASAGEPSSTPWELRTARVYPRECGGTPDARAPEPDPLGLSPRVRGNPSVIPAGQAGHRSIPASAGEPALLGTWLILDPVYPRECGGTPLAALQDHGGAGLSPRVRGNHQLAMCPNWPIRSIPASAGEPLAGRSVGLVMKVYPRECGGTDTTGEWVFVPGGLSPRVRGNRLNH